MPDIVYKGVATVISGKLQQVYGKKHKRLPSHISQKGSPMIEGYADSKTLEIQGMDYYKYLGSIFHAKVGNESKKGTLCTGSQMRTCKSWVTKS